MLSTDKPVIHARLFKDENGWHLENTRIRIDLDSNEIEFALAIYKLADGSKTLDEIVCHLGRRSDIEAFISFLVQNGLCAELQELSLIGDFFSRWPDPNRNVLSNEEVLELQRLPADPQTDIIEIGTPYLSRKTCRNFRSKPVAPSTITSIVQFSDGRAMDNSGFHRTNPSAGAMYPCQHFWIMQNIQDIPNKVYRLQNHSNHLSEIRDYEPYQLAACFLDDAYVTCAAIQVIVCDISRSAKKYGPRALRFALVEAGHIVGLSIVQAEKLGVGSWEYGGYSDTELIEFLDTNSVSSTIAAVTFYGYPEVHT